MKSIWMKISLMVVSVCFILTTSLVILLVDSNNKLKDMTLTTLDEVLRDGFDRSIKWEVQTASTMIKSLESLLSDGVITPSQEQVIAEHILREARYGESGYFWADKSDGTNVVLLGGDSEGKNRYELQDKKDNFLVKDLIANSKKSGGDYTNYWFPKAGGDEPLPKRSYSLYSSSKDWAIATGNYIDDIDVQINSYKESIESNIAKTIRSTLLIVIILFIVIITASIFIGIKLTKSIGYTSDALKDISLGEGDLTKKLEITSKDEIGVLSESFNNFNDKLRDIISKIKISITSTQDSRDELIASSTTTATSLSQISANSESIENQVGLLNSKVDESTSAMSNINRNIIGLDEQIGNQSTAVEESSASIIEMVASINSVANKSKDKSKIVTDMIAITNKGREEMEQTKLFVEDLSNSVNEILKVTSMIDDISSQSSLLSMNASIEAAHAGDAGRGFGVVAGEIRKLAESSSTYANNINATLQNNISYIENLKQSVNSSMIIFADVESKATDTESVFAEIINAMSELSAGANEINGAVSLLQTISIDVRDSSRDIKSTIDAMDSTTSGLKDITSTVVSAVSEINIGLNHIDDAMCALKDSALSISEDIDEINKEVNIFKI